MGDIVTRQQQRDFKRAIETMPDHALMDNETRRLLLQAVDSTTNIMALRIRALEMATDNCSQHEMTHSDMLNQIHQVLVSGESRSSPITAVFKRYKRVTSHNIDPYDRLIRQIYMRAGVDAVSKDLRRVHSGGKEFCVYNLAYLGAPEIMAFAPAGPPPNTPPEKVASVMDKRKGATSYGCQQKQPAKTRGFLQRVLPP